MTFREIRKAAGMTQKQIAAYFGIPIRTVEDWDAGKASCATYLLDLIEYKLRREGLL